MTSSNIIRLRAEEEAAEVEACLLRERPVVGDDGADEGEGVEGWALGRLFQSGGDVCGWVEGDGGEPWHGVSPFSERLMTVLASGLWINS